MQAVRALRAWSLDRIIADQAQFYAGGWTAESRRKWQLEAFNAQWEVICGRVPYFRRLREERGLPRRFQSWEEFCETVPPTDRSAVQSAGDAMVDPLAGRRSWRTTGGSTAEPLRVPVSCAEARRAAADVWYARSWFGVTPADRLFLVWGHSHALGAGLRGAVTRTQRRLKDSLLGYVRQSAYDLSEASLRRAGEALLKFRPTAVVGYSVALDRFARVNRDRRRAFQGLGLRVVIATAESFPRPDSADCIGDVLGCTVVMEYGSVETGAIAHQRLDGRFLVFWRHVFLECLESPHVADGGEVVVTALYPRCLPLVRYRLGDLVTRDGTADDVGERFGRVIGRCNDLVVLRDRTVVHSEAFSHAVKEIRGIEAYQVVQAADASITLAYVAPLPLPATERAELIRRLTAVHPLLAEVRVEHVKTLGQTIAGKTRRIRRESSS